MLIVVAIFIIFLLFWNFLLILNPGKDENLTKNKDRNPNDKRVADTTNLLT